MMEKNEIDYVPLPQFFDKLNEREKENIVQAKLEAESCRERLDPEHINTFSQLIFILESCLEDAKRQQELRKSINMMLRKK